MFSLPPQVIDGLFISSMIFFNLLCIVGILGGIYLLILARKLSDNANETLDKVKFATDNLGQVTGEALGILAQMTFLKPRRKSLWSSLVRALFDQ